MDTARESLKDQPIIRKVEQPTLSTDSWQQDQWSREDKSTVVNKVCLIKHDVIILPIRV